MPFENRVIRRTDTPALVGLSIATIDRLRRAGNFPPTVRLGENAVGFLRTDLEAWVISRLEVRQ